MTPLMGTLIVFSTGLGKQEALIAIKEINFPRIVIQLFALKGA